MKNVLLTGSGGFIGKNIKEQLKNSYNFIFPRSFELNLTDEKDVNIFFKENNIEFIIHCASCGVRITPESTLEEVARPNIKMFHNLVKHTCKNRKMIVLGSGAEYNKQNPIIDVKENEWKNSIPPDPYGYSKYMISKEIEASDNILNLRLFGVYGKYEHPSRVTSSIMNKIIKNEPVVLNQNVIFSFIYVNDLCKILDYFIKEFPKEKFINAVQSDKITIKELAEISNKISNNTCEIKFKKEGMNKEYSADNNLLKTLINFEFTTYKEGLTDLYKYLKEEN